MVIIEGLAAGCSVVASDLPAFRHVLGPEAHLVEPGDHVALAERIVEAIEARPQTDADAISASAARFDWSQVASEYRAAYRAAAGSG